MSKSTARTQMFKFPEKGKQEKMSPVFVVISGNLLDIGKMLHVGRKELVIGRNPGADFILNDEQISREHIRLGEIQTIDSQLAIKIQDLNSTNGTIVNGKKITTGWCKIGETVNLGETTLLLRLESTSIIRRSINPLQLISKDPLTKIYNRRAFDAVLNHEQQKETNREKDYCILAIDVDNLKQINDDFGHPTGDEVLKLVAEKLVSGVRATDVPARIGGDEFAILSIETKSAGGRQLAERLRDAIFSTDLKSIQPGLRISVSVGVSTGNLKEISLGEIYHLADQALLKAKKQGRNCIYLADKSS